MASVSPTPAAGGGSSIATRLGVAIAVVLLLAGGVWVAAGVIAPTYLTSIAFGIAWFVIASVLLGQVTKRRPDLKWPVRGTFLVTAAAAAGVFAWTSLRDDTVHEKVLTGVPAAQAGGSPAPSTPKKPAAPPMNVAVAKGDFQVADEGSAAGTATLIRKAKGGRVLTLTSFAVNNGPDLRVYLVPGDGKDTGRHIDLGGLKGNKGNQQYDVPGSTDTGRYRTVVIWCRAFSVAFARATLRA
jgi:hypothetical protein